MKVKVYSTPSCKYCSEVKTLLKENSVDYSEVDVSSNPEAKKEMVELSGQIGVPVTVTGESFVVGFDREKLLSLCQIK